MLRQELPSTGQILVNGRNVGALPVAKVPDLRRSIGVVFQDFKLIQRKTALENVAYVLNVAGVPRSEQRQRAYNALRSVGSEPPSSRPAPSALSGGRAAARGDRPGRGQRARPAAGRRAHGQPRSRSGRGDHAPVSRDQRTGDDRSRGDPRSRPDRAHAAPHGRPRTRRIVDVGDAESV